MRRSTVPAIASGIVAFALLLGGCASEPEGQDSAAAANTPDAQVAPEPAGDVDGPVWEGPYDVMWSEPRVAASGVAHTAHVTLESVDEAQLQFPPPPWGERVLRVTFVENESGEPVQMQSFDYFLRGDSLSEISCDPDDVFDVGFIYDIPDDELPEGSCVMWTLPALRVVDGEARMDSTHDTGSLEEDDGCAAALVPAKRDAARDVVVGADGQVESFAVTQRLLVNASGTFAGSLSPDELAAKFGSADLCHTAALIEVDISFTRAD